MSRLLIITQVVDPSDSDLGFFCEWLREFAADPRVSSIDVWCLRQGEWKDKPAHVTVCPLPSGSAARLSTFFSRLVTQRFDAVFVHMVPLWVVLGGWWWRITGQRVVLWYTHGSASTALRIATWFANKILTATQGVFPIQSAKVVAIGHGINPNFASVEHRTRKDDDLDFLSVGRVTPRKRVRETLALFAEILKQHPTSHFAWIGEPITDADRIYAEEVRKDVTRLGLSDRVSFGGPVQPVELPRYDANADCLLHLSATGSLDKVVLEALASGTPVFSTNPATKESVPTAYWSGELGTDAATEAIRRAKLGIKEAERHEIAERFALTTVIRRIIDSLVPTKL